MQKMKMKKKKLIKIILNITNTVQNKNNGTFIYYYIIKTNKQK